MGVYPFLVSTLRSEPVSIPAVIVDPSAESRRELSCVVRHALQGVPVTLADNALTISNMLAVGHANARDPAGRLLNGRELFHPQTFELYMRGPHCVLVRSENGQAWTLHHTRCAAMTSQTSR